MKMILAILSSNDASQVIEMLVQSGYSATRLASSGGFLKAGNVTVLVGTDESKTQKAIEIIKENSKSRMELSPVPSYDYNGNLTMQTAEAAVGGAAIFVLDVDHYEKV